jgi:4-amino-4-deoxy-L-arabinose transferase-like glycosyltransferase
MLQKNDWITPWINFHGEVKPYLGKPPLHFWLEQIAFLIFGQNNVAARLPSLLSGAGIVAAIGIGVSILIGVEASVVAMATLASSCLLFFLSGAVVLDVTLTLGITIALVSFLLSDVSRLARYTFFAGMALGVLVKGPLATVLVGATIVPWVAIYRITSGAWPAQLSAIPWLRGLLLFLVVVLPWYLMAELRNPGFLEYFLWNENLGRYLKSDYGDEYGTGHTQPFGASFVMMLLACAPWSFIIAFVLFAERRHTFNRQAVQSICAQPLLVFGIAWTLSCPVLLLGARQYTGTYLLPSVPGFAFLIAVLWGHCVQTGRIKSLRSILSSSIMIATLTTIILAIVSLCLGASVLAMIFVVVLQIFLAIQSKGSAYSAHSSLGYMVLVTAILYGGVTLGLNTHLSENRSTRQILAEAHLLPETSPGSVCLFFPYQVPFSASFYAPLLTNPSLQLSSQSRENSEESNCPYVIARLKEKDLPRFNQEIPALTEVKRTGRWRIFKRQETSIPHAKKS